MNEADRRRALQIAYNETHQIIPTSTLRKMNELRPDGRKIAENLAEKFETTIDTDDRLQHIKILESEMKKAAKNLEFELAASLRDRIEELKNN